MKIYSTRAHLKFAEELGKILDAPVSADAGIYPDGQVYVELKNIPRREDAVVVGNTMGAEQFEELRLLLHTIKRTDVRQVITVIPYFAAGRQDRAKFEGQDVAAKMHADEISDKNPDWVFLMDIHHGGIINFFDDGVKAREITAAPLFLEEIKKLNLEDYICASPDAGRFTWVQAYARNLGVEAVSLDKRREGPGKASIYHVVGEVAGKNVVLIDDIIDSGGTVISAAKALLKEGARSVHLFAVHLVLGGEGVGRFKAESDLFASLHGTDTIDSSGKDHNFHIHSVVDLFADYIKSVT